MNSGGDGWDERRKAQEEEYFHKQNKAAMDRLKKREEGKLRPSPITGEDMEQLTIMGVVVDRCPTTKGIWLDAGELEQIVEFVEENMKHGHQEGVDSAIRRFFKNVFNTEM